MSRYMTLLLPVSILADMYINTLARSLARSRDVRSVLIREGMINRGKKETFSREMLLLVSLSAFHIGY